MTFNPNQPRVPSGSSAGGEWGSGGMGSSGEGNQANSVVIDNIANPETTREYRNTLWRATNNLSTGEQLALTDFMNKNYELYREADRAGSDYESTYLGDFYAGYQKLPVYKGEMYRGLSNLDNAAVSNLLSGDTITLDAMSSFSRSEKIALLFARKSSEGTSVIMKFNSKNGRSAEHISLMPIEREVIATKGANYKINRSYRAKVKQDDGSYTTHLIIEGEEI